MTDLPPFPEPQYWDPLSLELTRTGPTATGTLTIGIAQYHVRGVHKDDQGRIVGEAQGVRDAVWEAWLASLDTRTEG